MQPDPHFLFMWPYLAGSGWALIQYGGYLYGKGNVNQKMHREDRKA
jgi:hypothetical protein